LFKLQEEITEPLLINKTQEHQERLGNFGCVADREMTVINVEASRKADAVTKPKTEGMIELGENRLAPACEHRRSMPRREHKLKNADSFLKEKKDQNKEGKLHEQISSLQHTKSFPQHNVAKTSEGRSRHKSQWERDNMDFQQRSSPKDFSEEKFEEFGDDGIRGITVVIHLEGRKDLVVKTDLDIR
jgi:hypothetical protein